MGTGRRPSRTLCSALYKIRKQGASGTKMRTGRPRAFCTDEAIAKAMPIFWRKGYEGTSIADLTEAIGINPPSLYAAFGSKEGLFRAVLDRYEQERKDDLDKILSAPTARSTA